MASDLLSKEPDGLSRRELLLMMGAAAGALASYSNDARAAPARANIAIEEVGSGEDVFAYVARVKGSFDPGFYQQVVGAANDFKEGDQTIGVGAADETTRMLVEGLVIRESLLEICQEIERAMVSFEARLKALEATRSLNGRARA